MQAGSLSAVEALPRAMQIGECSLGILLPKQDHHLLILYPLTGAAPPIKERMDSFSEAL